MDVRIAVLFAVLSGVLFAFLTPVSAIFLESAPPVFTVAALNLGAGLGMLLLVLFTRKTKVAKTSRKIEKKDFPYLIFIIIGDLLGALLSMMSLLYVSPDSVSLILNFEIVSTALIALFFFREKISRRLWIGIILITLGCITVTSGNMEYFITSPGVLMALGSCVCWGITHNLYKKVSYDNPFGILTIRGLGIGIIGFIIFLIAGENLPELSLIPIILALGFVTYGLGNVFYILSQRKLGAAMVAAICGLSPFLSAIICLLVFQTMPTLAFLVSFLLLIPGVWIAVTEGLKTKDTGLIETENIPKNPKDIRNTLSAVGFFIIAGYFFYSALSFVIFTFVDSSFKMMISTLGICCAVFLAIIGTILIILRKRDFIGITFLVYAIFISFASFIGNNSAFSLFLGIIACIIAGIFFLANDKKKYIIMLLFVFQGYNLIRNGVLNENFTPFILTFIMSGILFFLGILSSSMFPKFKLTKILTADESTDFRRSGSMIGFLVISLSISPWLLSYILRDETFSQDIIANITIICAVALLLIAVLLIFVGKSWFNGGIFIGISFTQILSVFSEGYLFYLIGIILLIFGLLAAFRKPPYLLFSLMLILNGISVFSSYAAVGTLSLVIVQILLNLIPVLIAVYLAAATFSQKWKLPLF